MALLIPWLAIDTVSDRLSGKEAREPEAESAGAAEIGRAMAGVPVTLRAEVAAIEVPIEQILSLGPGSLIRLGHAGRSGHHRIRRERQARPRTARRQRRPARDPGIRYREEVRMSQQQDITPREALMRLGASTAEAIAKVLENFTPGAVERGEVTVLEDGTSPFANVARGSIASSVSYVDGVTGANIFVLTPAGARLLASRDGRAGRRKRRTAPTRRRCPSSSCPRSPRPPTRRWPRPPPRSASCSARRSRSRRPTRACSTSPARPPTSTAPPPTRPRPRS